jgi:hypothetical protein
MWIFQTKPVSHRRMHLRDWSWKDGILIEHISNHKKRFSHIGACTCAHEPKTCVCGLFLIVGCILEIGHGKTEYSLNIYLTTQKNSATSERAHCTCAHEPKPGACGLFLIVGCILEIGHGKTKYSLNIYLISATSERARARMSRKCVYTSQKLTCTACFW